MANTNQARKRARQSLKRRAINISLRTEFRTAIKKVLKAIADGDKTVAQTEFFCPGIFFAPYFTIRDI